MRRRKPVPTRSPRPAQAAFTQEMRSKLPPDFETGPWFSSPALAVTALKEVTSFNLAPGFFEKEHLKHLTQHPQALCGLLWMATQNPAYPLLVLETPLLATRIAVQYIECLYDLVAGLTYEQAAPYDQRTLAAFLFGEILARYRTSREMLQSIVTTLYYRFELELEDVLGTLDRYQKASSAEYLPTSAAEITVKRLQVPYLFPALLVESPI